MMTEVSADPLSAPVKMTSSDGALVARQMAGRGWNAVAMIGAYGRRCDNGS